MGVTDNRAQTFAEALQQFEKDRDVDAFAQRFTDDAELVRPEQGGATSGSQGVRGFWTAYLDQFGQISSSFRRVVEAGDLGQLEWVSQGTLGSGTDVEYAGVSLLEFADDGRVRRFATYYDTEALAVRLG